MTLYFGNATVDTVLVTNLQAGSRTNVTFGWCIFPIRAFVFPPPWHDPMKPIHKIVTIKVEADVVPGETDTADNLLIDGTIDTVWMVTDVNGDGKHDMRDIGAVARYFGSDHPPPLVDFNSDGQMDMRDVGMSCRVFGSNYY